MNMHIHTEKDREKERTSERIGIPRLCMTTETFDGSICLSSRVDFSKHRKSTPSRCLNSLRRLSSSDQQTRPNDECRETHLSCLVGRTVYSFFRRLSFRNSTSSELIDPDLNASSQIKNTSKTYHIFI